MGIKTRIVTYLFVGGATVLAASPALLGFLGVWEGQGHYVVYADKLAGGLPTVCKGITHHTSQYPVVVGERWSADKCKAEEERIVIETQRQLQKCVTAAVPQSVFDALTSHAHNFGWPRTCASESVKAINSGYVELGCDLLAYTRGGQPNWSSVGTTFIQGLHNRRKAERELCLSDLR